ncbi:MAG: hypothetical protein ACKOCX_01030 [Planctomycetota bacterium]
MSHAPPRAVSRSPRARAVGWLLVMAALVASGGCLMGGGRGTDPVEPAAALGAGEARAANRTIPLELSFVRSSPQDEMLREELWQFVDEQALPAELRGRLAANGLRVGIVTGHLPPHLAARFTAAAAEAPQTGPLPTDAAVSRRLIRLLPGRRGEIVTASRVEELVLLEQSGGQVRGGTYRDASPLFAVQARPAADGRVHIEVTPEIRHGPMEKSWVGEDGMFRLESGQRRHRLEELQFALELPREGMLIVGCGGDGTATAGDCLLRDHDRGGEAAVRLLAIRPLAETVDPLFAPVDGVENEGGHDTPLVVR